MHTFSCFIYVHELTWTSESFSILREVKKLTFISPHLIVNFFSYQHTNNTAHMTEKSVICINLTKT